MLLLNSRMVLERVYMYIHSAHLGKTGGTFIARACSPSTKWNSRGAPHSSSAGKVARVRISVTIVARSRLYPATEFLESTMRYPDRPIDLENPERIDVSAGTNMFSYWSTTIRSICQRIEGDGTSPTKPACHVKR